MCTCTYNEMIVIVMFYIIMFSLCYSEHLHVIYGTFMLNICNLTICYICCFSFSYRLYLCSVHTVYVNTLYFIFENFTHVLYLCLGSCTYLSLTFIHENNKDDIHLHPVCIMTVNWTILNVHPVQKKKASCKLYNLIAFSLQVQLSHFSYCCLLFLSFWCFE